MMLTLASLQPEGVVKINSLGTLTDYEKTLVSAAVPELATNIEKASVLSSRKHHDDLPSSFSGCLLHLCI